MITRSKLTQIALAILTLAFLASVLPLSAFAQDDPPARVARIGYLRGNVSFNPAGTDDWTGAEINRPVTIGDKLWSDQDSLAELHLGPAAIRIGSNTAFTILNLDEGITQVSVNEGIINIHLRRFDGDDSFEVDTPNSAFSILRPGDYRLQVSSDGDYTLITVRNGEGEVNGGGQAFTVYSNQSAELDGTDQVSANLYDAYPPDDFDNWCYERNRREDDVPRWVSPDMVGYEDLNENGAWREVPEYGAMWVPNGMVGGWAPYRYGHWVWVSPWGWTWIDDAPWGFAPFHYGRWVQYGGVWGWLPGPIVAVRPVYAPALVAWVGGGGPEIGVGVAWFPLGPREVFVPPYAVSERYVTNLNVTSTNVTNVQVTNVYREVVINKTVTNITYVNRTYVTATSQQAFTGGQPVGRNIVKVDPQVLAKAQVSPARGAGIAPEVHSVVGAAPAARVRPPAAVVTRAVVAQKAPPPPPPSFAAQQKAIQSNGGKPLAVTQIKAMQPAAAARPAVRVAPPAPKTAPPPKTAARPPQPAPGAKPANMPAANAPRPANQPPAAIRPAPAPAPENKPAPPPANANRPAPAPENKPAPPPANANRPPANQPPAANRPAPAPENKPAPPPANANRPPASQPPANNNRPPAEAKPEQNKPAQEPATKPNEQQKQNKPDQKQKDDKKKKDEKDKPSGL